MSPRREPGVRAQRERLRASPALGVALPQLGYTPLLSASFFISLSQPRQLGSSLWCHFAGPPRYPNKGIAPTETQWPHSPLRFVQSSSATSSPLQSHPGEGDTIHAGIPLLPQLWFVSGIPSPAEPGIPHPGTATGLV